MAHHQHTVNSLEEYYQPGIRIKGCNSTLIQWQHDTFILQDYLPSNYSHNIEERSTNAPHDEYEVIAQAICTSMAIARGENGWTYAVRRVCLLDDPRVFKNCIEVCTMWLGLQYGDPQNRGLKWKCSGALHVFTHRPSSAPSSATQPSVGLKVLWTPGYETVFCGPNFCCCSVVTLVLSVLYN